MTASNASQRVLPGRALTYASSLPMREDRRRVRHVTPTRASCRGVAARAGACDAAPSESTVVNPSRLLLPTSPPSPSVNPKHPVSCISPKCRSKSPQAEQQSAFNARERQFLQPRTLTLARMTRGKKRALEESTSDEESSPLSSSSCPITPNTALAPAKKRARVQNHPEQLC